MYAHEATGNTHAKTFAVDVRRIRRAQCALESERTCDGSVASKRSSLTRLRHWWAGASTKSWENCVVIERIEASAAAHDGATRQSLRKTRQQASLLDDLRELHMLRVSQLAVAGNDAPVGLYRALKCPHKRTPLSKVLVAAHGMANAVAEHVSWFVSEGLKEDFVIRYRAAISDVERIVEERDVLGRRKIEASAAITLELQKGKRVVHSLDAVLRTALRETPELFHTWRKIKRTGA